MSDMEMFGFMQSFMTALFSNDPDALFEKVTEAGKMLGAAAFAEHEAQYRALIQAELQPVKDSLTLLMTTTGKVDELLDRLTNGKPDGIIGKAIAKMLEG